ncbi:hypothetical protein P3T76_014649 [Phytophthora citrophthora]|uniref:PX domain-containing protein n=1 Tax=Phytophthora citrophthora TaxID=4793 RepID=A0AAD9G1C4_9STRA|nr:hypothetical protein P3T76_014649 [Phytophthora citrophthora]
MGCSQSKTSTDQVVERVSVDVPAVETPVPESIKVTEPEPVVEAPPASADELPPASASVAVEEAPKSEEPAVEEPAAAEEAPKSEEVAAVEEAPKSEEVATAVEEAPAAEVEVVDEKTDAVEDEEKVVEKVEDPVEAEETTPEVQPEEAPVEAEPEAPKSEPVVNEEPPKSEEVPVETPAEEEVAVEEPKLEVAAALVSEVKPESTLTFKAEDVTFNDKGVAFYNFDGSDSSNPANDVHVSKRYSEFKTLHAQLSQQLTDNQDGKTSALPALPKASLLQGRKNQKMLQERKTQFTALLNAIAAHPVASQSDVFKAFLA